MPNHIHIIIHIKEIGLCSHCKGDRPVALTSGYAKGTAKQPIGSFVAGYKSAATKRINEWRRSPGLPVWQRNYYEHVIRDDEEAFRISEYIIDNPLRWDYDEYHA
jgi:putative transposase